MKLENYLNSQIGLSVSPNVQLDAVRRRSIDDQRLLGELLNSKPIWKAFTKD